MAEPASTMAQPLLAHALLDPSLAPRGFWQRAGFAEMTLADLLKP
jgi:membrane protein